MGAAFFGRVTVFAYLAIALGILTLTLWLLAGKWLDIASGSIAGILLAGALFSGLLGLALVPFSTIGLIVIVGIFGFTPLVTAFVYWRNGLRALRRANGTMISTHKRILVTASMIVAVLLVLGLPILAQWRAASVIREAARVLVSNPTAAQHEQASTILSAWTICAWGSAIQ